MTYTITFDQTDDGCRGWHTRTAEVEADDIEDAILGVELLLARDEAALLRIRCTDVEE